MGVYSFYKNKGKENKLMEILSGLVMAGLLIGSLGIGSIVLILVFIYKQF